MIIKYNKYNIIKSYNILRFIAGKSYYFGVGGGMRQFENLIIKDGIFDVKIVWKSKEGKYIFYNFTIFLNKQQLYIHTYKYIYIYIFRITKRNFKN